MRLVKIEPISRLEGEGRILIIVDDSGKVKDVYFEILELKGFEKFCIGRPVEEMPRIVTRICGVCPWAHHMASGKAVDTIFGREPTPTAKMIRELAYCAHQIDSHALHFYFLAVPDLLVSPDASKAERNVIYLYKKHPEVVREIVKHRNYVVKIESMIGGKSIHPVCCVPGGISKPLDKEKVEKISEMAKELIKFTEKWIDNWEKNIFEKYHELIMSKDKYYLETYYMGLVNQKDNSLNFYDGDIRVVDTKGREVHRFKPSDYLDYISERVEPWTYTKFPYLKKIGWKGFIDGQESGVYRVGPLARLNVIDKISTEKAQQAYERYLDAGGKPVHFSMFAHWARLIEMLYASERIQELTQSEDILSKEVINYDGEYVGEGVGVVEAPRGILYHHYKTDNNKLITMANMIVPTTQNNAPLCIDIKKSTMNIITNGQITESALNRIEMAFRAYDPCLACSAHSLPGRLPIKIEVYDTCGNLINEFRRE